MIESIRRTAQLERALDGRRVLVSGVRGTDSLGLVGNPLFGGSHALTMYDDHANSPATYEDLAGSRPALARFQFLGGNVEDGWVAGLRRLLEEDIAVVPYKAFSIHQRLGLGTTSWFLGLDPNLQNQFDDRNWVEEGLAQAGVDTIPWHTPLHKHALDEIGTPLVVRSKRSVGGSGFRLIDHERDLGALLRQKAARELSYARFYAGASHLSTLAVVDGYGQVSLHGISRQLVGLPSVTESAFEYCGNQFGVAAEINSDVSWELDRSTRQVGRWMASRGYLGAYGCDWLIWGGNVWLAEVNARFTGSVLGNDMVAAQLGQASVYFQHISAFLGVPRPVDVKASDLLSTSGCTVLHVISHERTPVVMTSPHEISGWSQVGQPRPGVSVEHGGTLAILSSSKHFDHSEKFDVEAAGLVAEVKSQFTEIDAPS